MQDVEMKRVTLLLVVALSLAGAFTGVADAAGSARAAIVREPELDREILDRINAIRESHGLRELKMSGELRNAAAYHSISMLEEGYFAHDSKDGTPFVARVKRFYSASGYDSWSAGENLVYDNSAMSADDAVRAWLESPDHRDNMLDPTWREAGIASAYATSAGGTFAGEPTWVITMDFGSRSGSKTARPAKAGAAAKKRPAAAAAVPGKPAKKPKKPKSAPPESTIVREFPAPALPDAVEQPGFDDESPIDDPSAADAPDESTEAELAPPAPPEDSGEEDDGATDGATDDGATDDGTAVEEPAFDPRLAR